ncbi:MAG: 1-acyl-sn-glycerol-3-phosphate [Gallionellaceae bacterium]|nr:MAG: 1-acyl-sn-glycerol-3-phosphate [Gallionellaceae bacterium]
MPRSPLTLALAVFRTTRFVLHLCYGAMLAIVFPSLNIHHQKRILRRWSAELLGILNVRISTAGSLSLQEVTKGMIVANHISWLDVIVLNAVLPLRFVAKAEVRHWPVIGWLCARAQTLFIERGKRSDTAHTNLRIAESLQQGNCMAIFPEGTTTDGSHVKHFHSSLLQPAIDAGAPIYPVAIRYHNKDGQHHQDAAYIDDMTFVESLWKILCSRDLNARLVATHALDTPTENRRALAQEARRRITFALFH